ncbi:hypothetical protein PG993_003658 [Apiospora rasikravindrae]|uniref:Uncharacterized protein n=1 Tax=Apiospora rasikravindrae TaxID=990691 RepID=A0ABR1U052_9PEZI
MADPTPYLPDPVWEDQIAPRNMWLSLHYIFHQEPSATPAEAQRQYQRLIAQLHANVEATLRLLPRFSARVVDDPRADHKGRIRLVAGPSSSRMGLLREWSKEAELSVEDVARIVEQADRPVPGTTGLGLPRPWDCSTARIDVLRVRAGVAVSFHAHHAIADMHALAVFAKCVAEGVSSLPVTLASPPRTQETPWEEEESCFDRAFENTYFRLEDEGGPVQPEARHRGFRYRGETKTYRLSRAKCKKLLAEEVPPESLPGGRGCSLFAFLIAKLGAHVLMARNAAGGGGDGPHGEGRLWIPVDVRSSLDKGGVGIVGNAVVPAAVRMGTEFWQGASGPKEMARGATVGVANHITSTIRVVKSRGYLQHRERCLEDLVQGHPSHLGVRFDATAGNWIQINDSRHFGADHEFPHYGKADVVRRSVPTSPGIVFHPVRAQDDTLVVAITLPEEAMDILQERQEFLSFMESIEAAPGT